VTVDVLSLRALNRATLERQLLLDRSGLGPVEAVEHLVGMQAQLPMNPYLGLWSRLKDFDPNELGRLVTDRKLVRIVLMRTTIHLVSADDCLTLRPLVQPALDGEFSRHREYAPKLRGVDLDPVLAFASRILGERPHTGPQLRAALATQFPDHDPAALAYACRNNLALVQVPPRGVWGKTSQVTVATAESWLGRPLAVDPSIDDVVLRYLGAFGPASVADVAAWSGLTGFREVVERLRPRLRTFRDPGGRELFDLPDAPRPDPETPAPPRFLPEYDNLLLSHADRSRFASEEHRRAWATGRIEGSVLHDGFGIATWWLDRDPAAGRTTLVVDHIVPLTKPAEAAIEAEGRRLLEFLDAAGADHDVRFAAVDRRQ
jgi:winged helix DNA-binding protein